MQTHRSLLHALVLDEVDGSGRFGERIIVTHADELDDGLDEQNHREDDHAHAHDLRESGGLHGRFFHDLEAIRLEERPSFNTKQQNGGNQIRKRLGMSLFQANHILW